MSFPKEIPETYTVKTVNPLKPVVDKMIICNHCFSQPEKLWIVCPYCAYKVIPPYIES